MRLIDAHVHINKNHSFHENIFYFLNTVNHEEWDFIIKHSQKKNVFGFAGVHPWYINTVPHNWEISLEELIKSNELLQVGEIGLDRIRAKRNPVELNLDKQIDFFKKQLEIALKYNRLITIHCVKAWDILLGIINEYKTGFKGILHYFSGSMQIMQKMIEKGFYISFFPNIYEHNREKNLDAFLQCPIDRLFLESDVYFGDSYEIIKDHYKKAAFVKEFEYDEFERVILNNAEIFTDRKINW